MTVKLSNMYATFADASIDYTGIGLNVTSTAEGSNSQLLDLKVNGSSVFSVDTSGGMVSNSSILVTNGVTANIVTANTINATSMNVTSMSTGSMSASNVAATSVNSTSVNATTVTTTNMLATTANSTTVNATTMKAGTANATSAGIGSLTANSIVIGAGAPASATDTGTAGQIKWDAGFIYVCIATNTWVRAALATWP